MGEEYQALYRKWRPMTFGDVIGQNQVSETLCNGIASGRIAHAYLFCGTRGTGKTSTAKIFSRAVNCENPHNGEPCNECPTCRGILDGTIMDVYEMDAASNRGVENIRDIRDEIMYTPSGCTYKVYIIDEVHMLTSEAFNALLKTLEEPPAHAIFILATTEPHKIPATVLSRCQRFDFRRIGVAEIAARLSMIADKEQIDADAEAIELIAQFGDGSMRDALSLLDRCAAYGGEKLTAEAVTEIVGAADPKLLFDIAAAAAECNTQRALMLADDFLHRGKEPQNFLEELVRHFRSLMLCRTADSPEKLLEKTAETAEKLKKQAELFSVETILYYVRVLSEAINQSKWMTDPKLAVEIAVVKMCTPSCSTAPEALLARIDKLERIVRDISVNSASTAVEVKKPAEEKKNSTDAPPWNVAENKKQDDTIAAKTVDSDKAVSASTAEGEWQDWAEALSEIKKESKSLYAFLYNGKAYFDGTTVELELDSQFAYSRIAKPEGLEYLSKLFTRVSGKQIKAAAYIKGEKKKKNNVTAGIMDLAAKKNILGDKIDIINN